MLLPTIFLSVFILSVSNFLKTSAGTQQLMLQEESNLTNLKAEPTSTNFNDVSLNQTIAKLNASIQILQANFKEQQNVQLQAIDKKLNKLQQAIEEQDMYGNKLTALEFTLNHVLSKVVYLSDNWQIRPKVESTKATPQLMQPEVFSRLGQLLRHVQNIERDNCRRSSIPAAAGPILASKAERLVKVATPNEGDNKNMLYIEELLRKLDLRLNMLSKFTNLGTELKQLPTLIKQNGAQLTRIFDFVNQLNNEETQQNSWQHMLEYCQGVSDEFSTFTVRSDALLKRIESIVQDTRNRIENLQIDDFDNKKHKSSFQKKEKCKPEEPIKREHNTQQTNGEEHSLEDKPKKVNENEHKKVIQASNKTGCHDLDSEVDKDGIYAFGGVTDLNEIGRDFNQRYCTFATDERAWTVIQQRGPFEVQENFNRSWIDYRTGFGDLSKDFWFGNEFIHRLTYFNNYELLVELESFHGGKMSISYGTFGLDSERVNYNLFVGDYKGPGPDSLSYHNFMDFSTFDRRNDKSVDDCCPCAIGYGSGWWFDNCLEANLNGIYQSTPNGHNYVGIIWEHWLGDYSLKAARMLIRPRNYVNSTFEDP